MVLYATNNVFFFVLLSLKTSVAVAATAIGLTTLAYPAEAAKFSFSYNDPANSIVLSGILTGTATGNIINIDGFSDLVYNGVSLPFSTSSGGIVDPYFSFSNPGNQAKASFDGSVMDFVLWDDTMTDYVGFGPAISLVGLAFTSSITEVTVPGGVPGDLMGNEVAFDPSKWEAALIPEPSAVVGLLGLGLGALASRGKKRG